MRKAKKVVSLRFDDDLCNKIQDRAESMGISFSAVVRIAVEAGLNANLLEPGSNFATPSSDEAMKAAILLLAQGNENEDAIADILGESVVSFPQKEIRKVPKTTKSAKVDSKKVRKPDRESVTEVPMSTQQPEEQPTKTEPTPIAVVKPLAQKTETPTETPTEVPRMVPQAAGANDNVAEDEQENIIEVSESTDVSFSDDMMANLDSMLGL